jgi:hypothetical protein
MSAKTAIELCSEFAGHHQREKAFCITPSGEISIANKRGGIQRVFAIAKSQPLRIV